MTIKDFFSLCTSSNNRAHEKTSAVILFSAKEFYPLLFSSLFTYIRSSFGFFPKKIMFQEVSFVEIQAQLETTFLGQKEFLWLGNISEIEEFFFKKQIFSVCKTYKGPHVLLGFISSEDKDNFKNQPIIDLDELSTQEKNMFFSEIFSQNIVTRAQDFLKNFPKASFDQIIIIFYYTAVLSKNTHNQFKQEWLSKIVALESSLFELAQYFFARKSEQFWNIWHKVKEDYAAPFWTAFWSEQLWRAYYVIDLYKQNRIVEAKQLSFKLPFSFLQKDWKHISLNELTKAHDFLYQGDYSSKNGSSDYFLEVFYASFLTKSF